MRLLLLACLTASPALAGRALVIGADDGGVSLPRLRYATDDAERVGATLESLGGFAVTRLVDPTPDAVLDALAVEATRVQDGPFVLYISGHADPHGLRLGDAHLAWTSIRTAVQAVEAPVTVGILDTCHSGVMARGATVVDGLGEAAAVEGEAWLAAAGPTGRAAESARLGGGTFTHHLLAGLRGAAAGDDLDVTLGEAWQYASSRTRADTALSGPGSQRPVRAIRLRGHGDVVLTRVSRASAVLHLPAGPGGRHAILHHGRVLVEADLPAGRPIDLAVPPGEVVVRRRGVDGLEEARLELAAGEVVPVVGFSPEDAGPVALRGGSDAPGPVREPDADTLLRLAVDERLGELWRVTRATLRVDGAPVWSGEAHDLDLSALHVASLPAGATEVTLSVSVRPRLPEGRGPTLHLEHREVVRLRADTRSDVTLTLRSRAPWQALDERLEIRTHRIDRPLAPTLALARPPSG